MSEIHTIIVTWRGLPPDVKSLARERGILHVTYGQCLAGVGADLILVEDLGRYTAHPAMYHVNTVDKMHEAMEWVKNSLRCRLLPGGRLQYF